MSFMRIKSRFNIKFWISTLLIFYLLCNVLSAQSTGTLRGIVADSLSGEALAYANIYIENLGIGASSDSRGYFIIRSIPVNNNYTAVVSYIGYKKKNVTFNVLRNSITDIKVYLSPTEIELKTVEKTGRRPGENVTSIGLQKISMKQINSLPKGVEGDVFRSLKYLPGIQTTNDVTTSFNVRGGANNENLFLLDDIPVYNPFHALGLFGSIDPEVIKNLELHLGGFGTKYSGRLSSVIKLITKDGNRNKYKASFNSSLMSVKSSLQGPYGGGSFIISGRKSYSNKILNNFLDEDNIPIKFYDLFFKANYENPKLAENGKFSIEGFFSGDQIINNNPLLADAKWSNNILGISWFQFVDKPLFYKINFSYSNFEGEFIPNSSGERPVKNNVKDYTGKIDISYVYASKDQLGVGIKIKEVSTDLFLQNSFGQTANVGQREDRVNVNLSLYANYRLLRFKDLSLEFGSRLNLVGLSQSGENRYLEPRASLSYNFSNNLSLKAAWGIYQQEITTFTDEDVVITYFEPWIVTPPYLNPAKSNHYVSGFEWNPNSNLSLSVEGYYKTSDNLPVLNDKKIFLTDKDFVTGSSKAYGIDVLFRYRFSFFNFSASYSHGYVNKKVDNLTYIPRYDIRNSLKTIFDFNIYKGWKASVTWVYYSGVPFTLLTGFYDKLHFNGQQNKFSLFGSQVITPLLGKRNASRLPAYHRLDLNVSKKFDFAFAKVYLNFSIINVYNRANIFYFDRNTGQRVNMLPFLPTFVVKVEL